MSAIDQSRVAAAVEMMLDVEHRRFGKQIGLLDKPTPALTFEQHVELIYAIDELGQAESDADARVAVQLIALAWEHSTEQQKAQIRRLCVSVLSRIGVSPSASMLEVDRQGAGVLSSLNSLSSEMASSLYQVAYSEVVGKVEYYLTKFQALVLDAVSEKKVIGVSAPTSAGKSFALYLCIVRMALSGSRSMIYIVPTISLMNQVSRDLRELIELHGLVDWQILTSFDSASEKRIFVMTQERALPHQLANVSSPFAMIIVDEVQNLERFSEDKDIRSKILLDSIMELYEKSGDAKVVLSGPRVSNLSGLGKSLFGVSAEEVETGQAPVASLTYAISKDKNGALLTQYSELYRAGRPLRAALGVSVPGIGKSLYSDEYLEYICGLLSRLGSASRPIIFSPTADQARKTAVGLIGNMASAGKAASSARSTLAKYISDSVHPKYDLVRCVEAGVGFHTGRMPPHIRLVCEMAYSEGDLSTMVCTTTLMQGVNLPANIVIARNPNLFIRRKGDGSDPKLSPYEFSNLRGRAGRLMKDFVGRTLVMDGDSFNEKKDGDLFPDPSKDVKPSYKELFERDRDAVVDALMNPGDEDEHSRFICSQIRYSVMRFGSSAAGRLATKGVDLPPAVVADVAKQLSRLDVGRDVCLANRYWDPFDLQAVKDNFVSSGIAELPDSPWRIESGHLHQLIELQARVSPFYFERYLGSGQLERLHTLSISALDWARETPLHEMLKSIYSPGNEAAAIESRVSDIQKHVIYGIPALLKPIADIAGSGQGLLASVETGVFSSVGRMLVAKGLYRDTAVTVRRKLLPKLDGDVDTVAKVGIELLDGQLHKLDYWVRRQVEPLLNQWKRSV
ncbi:DEAD/DEAH box helicase [Xanthomonas cannabis]|uniref:DEAD/DEAH box helicase n=1 Tax=Xanthomonas cannabis TaxID=1885674 RepID=UPI0033B85EEE